MSAAFGNAATRLDAFVAAGDLFTYGTYPEIENLLKRQAMESDCARREALLHRAQQLMHEKVMYAPLLEAGQHRGLRAARREAGHRAHHLHVELGTLRGAAAQDEVTARRRQRVARSGQVRR